MKTKLFSLCLMAVLCFPLMAYSQYYDVVEEASYAQQKTTDSLKKLSMDYYKDLSHWTIFIEPAVTVNEDTVFDPAGLKHAYYVRRFYFFALPEKSDFQYQPKVLGPYLYAYGQKMPVEGKDAQHFQMIRKAVFPFASDFSANTPSHTIFQQYAEKNFDQDYHYIIDSLMVLCVKNLDRYDLTDTAQKKYDSYYESSSKNEPVTIISCLENEYAQAIPQPTIIEAPAREPIATPKSIEHLKKVAVKTEGNRYILPQSTILNQIAQERDDDYLYYESAFSSASISGQSYFMLNDHAVVLHPETYLLSNFYSPELKEESNYDTVLIISPNQIEKMTLTDCYQSCLKDDLDFFEEAFPPFLNVRLFVDEDEDEYAYYDCKECYEKEAILKHLKEGSVMYDYFAKDFYLNDLRYKDSKSIGYYSPHTHWYQDDDAVADETIYFSKEQSQQIRKLLAKRNRLLDQFVSLGGQYAKTEHAKFIWEWLLSRQHIYAEHTTQIPKGQLHITKIGEEWEVGGESNPNEAAYDDEPVVIEVDEVGDMDNHKNKKTKFEKKIEKMEKRMEKLEKKADELDSRMQQINEEIERIAGHPIMF